MDIVYIKALEIETVIGIYDWERRLKQKVIIDLDMGFDIRAAAKTDSIEATLDYKAVAHRVRDFVAVSQFQLVETLAERICELVLSEFPVKSVSLTLAKPGAVRGAEQVGVRIERRALAQLSTVDSERLSCDVGVVD